MNYKSLFTVLLLSTMLTACGGGGGGSGHIPTTTLPNNPPPSSDQDNSGSTTNPDDSDNSSNPGDSGNTGNPDNSGDTTDPDDSGNSDTPPSTPVVTPATNIKPINNATERETNYNNAVAAVTSKAKNTIPDIDTAYANMNTILVDGDTSTATEIDILLSLALIGEDITDLKGKALDDLKTQAQNIDKATAEDVYAKLGTERTLSLADVKFKSIDFSEADRDIYSFTLDSEGNIVGVKREGIDFVLSECNEGNCLYKNETYNATLEIDSYGKNVGLKYADFGTAEIIGSGEHYAFAGGYETLSAKAKDLPQVDTEMNFKGQAVAALTYEPADSGDSTDVLAKHTGTSNLNFKDGKETLVTDFTNDGWHKVTVTTDTTKYSGYAFTFDGTATDSRFAVTQPSANYNFVDIQYYGENPKNPDEVAGSTIYEEEYSNGASLEAAIAFGATRQK